ncbi:hypothetical protein GOV12_00005, partial [Candidatus Pacearchaeota archaeon]|nr:hypothetical protein [Candidatus Pacearchaeota archaeon]
LENLEEGNSKYYFWLLIIGIIIILVIIIYLIYYKYYKKNKKAFDDIKDVNSEKPFDYKFESRKLLKESKKLFNLKKHKDAYEKAGQAIRLFLSHKYHLKIETTNDDIIRYLKLQNMDITKIKECFDLCCLVEFAKYKANIKDFNMILKIGEDIIR